MSDIDGTVLGNDEGFLAFRNAVQASPGLVVVFNSSRPIESVKRSLIDLPAPFLPDGLITAMGTEVTHGGKFDTRWQSRFGDWDRSIVDEIMNGLGAAPHPDEFQTPFKASYAVGGTRMQGKARAALAASGQPSRIVVSGESDFDVLPPASGKGEATLYVAALLGVDASARLVVAGDSANDLEMFEVSRRGILVGNAREELRAAVAADRAYQASAQYARGVLEGLRHWGALREEVPMNSRARS